jgi:ubiquinone/menaquinone biosynthesis C-methylase UbiE
LIFCLFVIIAMDHHDHLDLLRGGVPSAGGAWADLGSGTGAFTLALAELIGPAGTIYSVDKDQAALRRQAEAVRSRFPDAPIVYRQADFTRQLELPVLDGVVMANSLHFIKPSLEPAVLKLIKGYLKPGGRLILVEYNVDAGNMWVPYPISFTNWQVLARQAGFGSTRMLAVKPSRFLKEIYSAESCKSATGLNLVLWP